MARKSASAMRGTSKTRTVRVVIAASRIPCGSPDGRNIWMVCGKAAVLIWPPCGPIHRRTFPTVSVLCSSHTPNWTATGSEPRAPRRSSNKLVGHSACVVAGRGCPGSDYLSSLHVVAAQEVGDGPDEGGKGRRIHRQRRRSRKSDEGANASTTKRRNPSPALTSLCFQSAAVAASMRSSQAIACARSLPHMAGSVAASGIRRGVRAGRRSRSGSRR